MSGFRQIMKGGFLQPTSDPFLQIMGIKIGILSGLGGEIFTYHFSFRKLRQVIWNL